MNEENERMKPTWNGNEADMEWTTWNGNEADLERNGVGIFEI